MIASAKAKSANAPVVITKTWIVALDGPAAGSGWVVGTAEMLTGTAGRRSGLDSWTGSAGASSKDSAAVSSGSGTDGASRGTKGPSDVGVSRSILGTGALAPVPWAAIAKSRGAATTGMVG